MNQTTNYKLNQWQRHDRVLMDDFNSDNAKIDAALKAEADAREAAVEAEAAAREAADAAIYGQLAKRGNCRIVYRTYVGNGTCGEEHPITLTFDGKPLLVLIGGDGRMMAYMLRGVSETMPIHWETGPLYATWGDNSIRWYSSAYDAKYQLNLNNRTYHVVAFLAIN